jgi:osmotically-inducible protein OsmY
MSRRMVVSGVVLFSALALLWLTVLSGTGGAHFAVPEPQPQTINCDDKKAVVKAIYNKFRADQNLKDQINNINVSFKNGEVTLTGCAVAPTRVRDRQAGIKQAIKLAREATTCEQRVINRLSTNCVSCPDTKIPCGSTCIEAGEDCNLPPPPPEGQ